MVFRYMLKKFKAFFFSLLAIFPQLALAANDSAALLSGGGLNWSQLRDVTYQIFVTRFGDLSTNVLSSIFGSMGGVLPAVGPDPVTARLFAVLNLGIWALAGGVVTYVTIRGIVDTSREGSILGQQTQGTLAFRVVTGLALLTPKVSGYSIIQVLAMWVILQGVNLANATWDSFVNYFAGGGDTQIQIENPTPAEMTALINGGVADMLRSATCMYALQKSEQALAATARASLGSCRGLSCPLANRMAGISSNYSPREVNDKLIFGGNRGASLGDTTTMCGTYNWEVQGARGNQVDPTMTSYQNHKREAMLILAGSLSRVAKRIFQWTQGEGHVSSDSGDHSTSVDRAISDKALPGCLNISDQQLESGDYCSETDAIYIAALTYMDNMKAVRLKRLRELAGTLGGDVFTEAKKQGWMSAGVFHRRLLTQDATLSSEVDTDYLFAAEPRAGPAFLKKRGGGSVALDMSDKATLVALKVALSQQATVDLMVALRTLGDPYMEGSTVARDYVRQADDLYRYNYSLTQFSGQDFDWKEPPKKRRASSVGFVKMMTFHQVDLGKDRDAWMRRNNTIFDRIVKSRESALSDIVPGGDSTTHKVGQDVVNLWVDSWKAWKGFSNPQERTGDPIEDLRVFGEGLMRASMHFWRVVARHVFEAVTILATTFTVAGVVTAAIGGAIHTIGEVIYQVGVMTIILAPILVPIGLALKGVGLPIMTAHSLFNLFFYITLAVLFYYLPIALATAVPIFMTGLILGVYVPLIPFILFSFASLGWLISVIESIAAAPLVALGITYPVGHDFLGRSEVALTLILNVFVRPVAMVIGLGAAMVVSYIILSFVNHGFTYLLGVAVEYLAGRGAAITFISSIGMILIYTFIVMSLVTSIYGMIYKIPEQLAKWVGSHPEPSHEPGLLNEVKYGLARTGGGMVAGAGEMVNAFKGAMKVDPGAAQGGGIAGLFGGRG